MEHSAYKAVRGDGAGIIDLTSRGRIRVSGSEAVMFLNGLITNDMKALAQHQWMLAAFPNVQGRLIAAVRVIRLPDQDNTPRFLLDTEAPTHKSVLKTIQRFTLAGDFKVNDITDETSCFSVQGKQSLSLVQTVLDHFDCALPRDGVQSTSNGTATIIRASHTAENGVDIIIDRESSATISERLVEAGAIGVDPETFETLRIEAGVPQFGKDRNKTNVVTETNLDDAVSFTKGCYIGQEIIARIKYRGHVAKKLTGLTFEGSRFAREGTAIRSNEGKEIGRTTSV